MSTTQRLAVTNAFTTVVVSIGLFIWLLFLTIYVCQRVDGTTIRTEAIVAVCSVAKNEEHSRVIMFNMTSPNMPLVIPIMPGLLFDTTEIVNGACSGVVNSINYTSGEISYTPSFEELQTVLDIFQYRALDNCSVWHVVTQSVCSQTTIVPPIIENGCYPELPESISPSFVYTFPMVTATMGENPIDWPSFQFVTFEAYYEFVDVEIGPATICMNSDESQRAMIPWGTSELESPFFSPQITPAVAQPPTLPATTAVLTSPTPFGPGGTSFTHTLQHIGSGVIRYSQTQAGAASAPVPVAFRIRVRVFDTTGLVSNTATLYLFVTESGGAGEK